MEIIITALIWLINIDVFSTSKLSESLHQSALVLDIISESSLANSLPASWLNRLEGILEDGLSVSTERLVARLDSLSAWGLSLQVLQLALAAQEPVVLVVSLSVVARASEETVNLSDGESGQSDDAGLGVGVALDQQLVFQLESNSVVDSSHDDLLIRLVLVFVLVW